MLVIHIFLNSTYLCENKNSLYFFMNENIIYIGSDNGLYASFNMGKTFMTLDNNLPRVPVHDITIQQRENELLVGTYGRSIYVTKLDAVHKVYDKMMEGKK